MSSLTSSSTLLWMLTWQLSILNLPSKTASKVLISMKNLKLYQFQIAQVFNSCVVFSHFFVLGCCWLIYLIKVKLLQKNSSVTSPESQVCPKVNRKWLHRNKSIKNSPLFDKIWISFLLFAQWLTVINSYTLIFTIPTHPIFLETYQRAPVKQKINK